MDKRLEKSKPAARNLPLILAVDDDPAVLRIIESQLTRHDFAVKTAPSGEEALRLLRDLTPAVMILDVVRREFRATTCATWSNAIRGSRKCRSSF
jgi:DNA-binding response OmpR family regulator